jgi:hypothetical protein
MVRSFVLGVCDFQDLVFFRVFFACLTSLVFLTFRVSFMFRVSLTFRFSFMFRFSLMFRVSLIIGAQIDIYYVQNNISVTHEYH